PVALIKEDVDTDTWNEVGVRSWYGNHVRGSGECVWRRGIFRRRWTVSNRRWGLSRRRWAISGTGDLVSLRIHALLIGDVIAPLELILGRGGRTARDRSSGEEARPRADCRTGARMA